MACICFGGVCAPSVETVLRGLRFQNISYPCFEYSKDSLFPLRRPKVTATSDRLKLLMLISKWSIFLTTNPQPPVEKIWIELFIRSIISKISSSDCSVVKAFNFVFAWQQIVLSFVGLNICTKTENWIFKGPSSAILFLTNIFRPAKCSIAKLNTSIWLYACNLKDWKKFFDCKFSLLLLNLILTFAETSVWVPWTSSSRLAHNEVSP